MLKRLRVQNFESHEDTELKDFSPGFNAIVGLSNSGKTSLIRALRLLACQQFDKASLRHGCDNCTVEAETDKGIVKVVRGKENTWTVTDFATGKTSVYDRVGKSILADASAILGFGMIRLGDIEMSANIMDQLEAHFMLSEFSGQDSTGSLRAQVVDEISGLHGIEPLIREVGLDNNRLTREINQLEERRLERASRLHDPALLKGEGDVLARAEACLGTHDESRGAAALLSGMRADHGGEAESAAKCEAAAALLPDDASAAWRVCVAEKGFRLAVQMEAMASAWEAEMTGALATEGELSSLPDTTVSESLRVDAESKLGLAAKTAETLAAWRREDEGKCRVEREASVLPSEAGVLERVLEADRMLAKGAMARELLARFSAEESAASAVFGSLGSAEDPDGALAAVLRAEKALRQAALASSNLEGRMRQQEVLEAMEGDEARLAAEESSAHAALVSALADVDVCPVTLEAMSGECRRKAGAA